MPSRVTRHWLLRDARRTGVLLVWVAFGFSILFYFIDWTTTRREATLRPPVNASTAKTNGDELYTGSIIMVPTRGEDCWQRIIDNRTGKMRDIGYVNCYEAVSRSDKDRQGTTSVMRLNSIGKAFRHDGD